MKKVLIIAGGTGGHIFPALAIAHALKAEDFSVEWLGSAHGMEKQLVADQYPLHLLPVRAIRGKGFLKKCLAPIMILDSVCRAYGFIKKLNPDVVIGMGGYASGPGGLAARLLGKPLIIHEQNAIAGLTNRLLARFATTVFEAFPNSFRHTNKAITIGNPIRQNLLALPSVRARFSDRSGPMRILVLGGSQGARAINQAVCALLPLLPKESPLLFWHQTGQADFDQVSAQYESHSALCYRVAPFVKEIASAYVWADLVICRAGALTVSELTAVGVASILVPFPHAVDDHQTGNARSLSDHQAAILMPQTELSSLRLKDCILDLLHHREKLIEMAESARELCKPNAVREIVACCKRLCR